MAKTRRHCHSFMTLPNVAVPKDGGGEAGVSSFRGSVISRIIASSKASGSF
jgi:hypothetical protein